MPNPTLHTTAEDMSVDALILSLIAASRQASEDELQRIVTHLAQASFAPRLVRLTRWLRDQLATRGVALQGDKVSAVEAHLLKRIHLDRQWPPDATADDYLADLHRAMLHPAAQVWTYRYYGEPMIGFLSPSHMQNVPSPQPFIFVAYNPRYGAIVTGYQASGPDAIFIDGFEQVRKQR